MQRRRLMAVPILLALLILLGAGSAVAQVATLGTPPPDAAASQAPDEVVNEDEAILDFVACLRENGLDLPDPQFGPDGVRFTDPTVLLRIDIRSREFLDAVEVCQEHLDAIQPELDPEQQAEQNEQLLAFAECMRREGIDFPDPDPLRGYSISSIRGPDGELAFDPFTPDFIEASGICAGEIGMTLPGAAGVP